MERSFHNKLYISILKKNVVETKGQFIIIFWFSWSCMHINTDNKGGSRDPSTAMQT